MTKTTKARKLSPADAAKAAERKAERDALVAKLDTFDLLELAEEAGGNADFTATWNKLTGHYSERNSMLIMLQCPEVTEVKAYGAWRTEGRQVRRGTRGISILAPAGTAKREGDVEIVADAPSAAEGDAKPGRKFFRWITIFDISQTDLATATEPSRTPNLDDFLK